MREKTFIYVMDSLYHEKEVKTADISFVDGHLKVGEQLYRIQINGDEKNVPKAFVPDFGDGFPRIICDWKGWYPPYQEETDWMLDDITLYPIEQRQEVGACAFRT